MSLAAWIVVGGLLGLVIVYLSRPVFEEKAISSARFFDELPPPQQQVRFGAGKPLRSPPFYLQLLALAALLSALLLIDRTLEGRRSVRALGAWVLVDTSSSMGTGQGGATRLELAATEVRTLLQQELPEGVEACWRLSAFDMERRDLVATRARGELMSALRRLEPRPLGTDLAIVRAAVTGEVETGEDCPLTHVVVVSDVPAPDWLAAAALPVTWRDVEARVPNVGFQALTPVRDATRGHVRAMAVEVVAHGPRPPTRLRLTAEDGSLAETVSVDWPSIGPWIWSFEPQAPGLHRLELVPGGAHSGDDVVVLDVPPVQSVRVDWRAPGKEWARRLGWTLDAAEPDVRVVSADVVPDSVPTLQVGPGYAAGATSQPLGAFREGHALLAGLNLDAVELARVPPLPLHAGHVPILAGIGGRPWVAARSDPPSVLLPGLPTSGDDALARVSATLFVNAVGVLLQGRDTQPWYSLTSPAQPEPEGSRIELHPGEGETWRDPVSRGAIEDVQPTLVDARREQPLWPALVLLAIAFVTIDQVLLARLGRRWR